MAFGEPMKKENTPNEMERQRIYCERNASGYLLDWCFSYIMMLMIVVVAVVWGIKKLRR
jgi:hypothetical protein